MTVVITFQPRFAPLVESGTKAQTIRKERKRPIKVGDMLSLREWTGKPYASVQRRLRPETPCIGVYPITITDHGVDCQCYMDVLTCDYSTAVARADGFDSFFFMWRWFYDTHGLPFTGILIRWSI